MESDQLTQNLLIRNVRPHSLVQPYLYETYSRQLQKKQKNNRNRRKSLDFQEQEETQLYFNLLENRRKVEWNEQEIKQRSLILEDDDNDLQDNTLINKPQQPNKNSGMISHVQHIGSYLNQQTQFKLKNMTKNASKGKKDLNARIFGLSKSLLVFIYYFNFFFNGLFRASLIYILVLLITQEKNYTLMAVIIGLEGVAILLYLIAMHKMLYTKSSDISVHFQKVFYQKPYAQIHMDRIMRKHFTLHNMVKNFTKFSNPCTKFRKDLKISVIRQQIFKRMEIIFVFIPIVLTFVIQIHWFDFQEINSQALIGVSFCLETVRIFLHYLIIYIYS